mmetsp:Transcript_60462/g.177323  ORF Transcript_60462/g.177323 Transcript_60462/m.177323 type:complete len:243 (-) Transcript_60462:355-1083(-)
MPWSFSLKCFSTSNSSCVRCCSWDSSPSTLTRSVRSSSRASRTCASMRWESSSMPCSCSSSLLCLAHSDTVSCSFSIRLHSVCSCLLTSSNNPCRSSSWLFTSASSSSRCRRSRSRSASSSVRARYSDWRSRIWARRCFSRSTKRCSDLWCSPTASLSCCSRSLALPVDDERSRVSARSSTRASCKESEAWSCWDRSGAKSSRSFRISRSACIAESRYLAASALAASFSSSTSFRCASSLTA